MKKNQSVSVVIPNYNCLSTLPRAVNSVRQQEGDKEIIVVDDGSTDGSRQWLEKQKDIKMIYTEGAGASGARNLAIKHCSHELIAFLDADDCWLDGKLCQQLALHDSDPDLVFSFTDYQHVSESGCSLIGCFEFWPRFSRLMAKSPRQRVIDNITPVLFAENVVGTSTVIVSKSALRDSGGFDTNIKSASDWDLWLKLSLLGKVGVLDDKLCHYTSGRSGAISRDQNRRLLAMKQILAKYTPAVRQYPSSLLAGYLRWLTGKAEYNRAKHAYLTAMAQELVVFFLQPQWRRIKAAGGDAVRFLCVK